MKTEMMESHPGTSDHDRNALGSLVADLMKLKRPVAPVTPGGWEDVQEWETHRALRQKLHYSCSHRLYAGTFDESLMMNPCHSSSLPCRKLCLPLLLLDWWFDGWDHGLFRRGKLELVDKGWVKGNVCVSSAWILHAYCIITSLFKKRDSQARSKFRLTWGVSLMACTLTGE